MAQLTQEQIAKEQMSEKQFNQLSEQVIGATPWGQFYGLMKGASNAGEGMLKHQVCLDKNGRNIKVYKGAGKVVGAFLKPSHEYTMQYISRKEWGKAALSLTGLYGQLQSIKEQRQTQRGGCITVIPDEIIALQKQKEARLAAQRAAGVPEKKQMDVRTFALIVIGIIVVILVIAYAIINRKK
jgi:hypothetical protein